MSLASTNRRRGTPLAMLGLLLGVWITGRAALWESPFPIEVLDLELPEILLARDNARHDAPSADESAPDNSAASLAAVRPVAASGVDPYGPNLITTSPPAHAPRMNSAIAAGHQLLMAAAFEVDWSSGTARIAQPSPVEKGASPSSGPPFAAPFPEPARRAMDRWSLDAFAYFRQGSDARAISQGRAPLYGASQASAILQYRLAPASSHDPRAYVRGYRALVKDGESEVAAGVSARPVGVVPLRVAAELRVTDNVFGTERRPAGYVVTELPPLRLPLDFRAEAYASAGYVGGKAATPFADGQAAITGEVVRLQRDRGRPVTLRIGAGAWGGAQRDAHRIDVGPTMRIDMDVGEVPARLSVDWREQVSGDAAPSSGVAATLSTRF